jgi:hypothetical protein
VYVAQRHAVDKAFAEHDTIGSLKQSALIAAAAARAGNF